MINNLENNEAITSKSIKIWSKKEKNSSDILGEKDKTSKLLRNDKEHVIDWSIP